MGARTVTILLSTYNGASFLDLQLNSILAQSYLHRAIRVRDDGSTDATTQILCRYARSYPSITVDYGTHKGVIPSYFSLLRTAENGSEYFAFADQDDFWLPTKLESAVAALEEHDADRPLLYCSAVEYVDAQLNHLAYSKRPKRLGLGNALVENVAVGATVVINRTARTMILSNVPQNALMHDWWMYLVVSAFGEVIYDPSPRLKYRQHRANAVGWSRGFRRLFLGPAANLIRRSRGTTQTEQANELLQLYGSALAKRDYDILIRFLAAKRSLRSRMIYACRPDVWRQSPVDDLKLRALMITGRY